MSLPRGAPMKGGALLAPFRYITDLEVTAGGWLLKGGRPFSLMPGWTLATYDAKRGVDEDVYLACPGTDPLGILGYRGAVLHPHGGINDVAAQALPPPPAAGQVCQGALQKEGGASWPSLPPAVTAVLAATMVPTTASRRQHRAAAALRRQGSGRTGCRFLGQPLGGF